MDTERNTDHWLDKAAKQEIRMLNEPDATTREMARRSANLAFRQAMRKDGNEGWKGDIIPRT